MYRSEAQRAKSKDGVSDGEGSHRIPLYDGNSNDSSSFQRLSGRDGSGETSDADKWFFRSNNKRHENVQSFQDDDPPFYLHKSSSSGSLPEDQPQPWSQQGLTGDPTRQSRLGKGLSQLEDDRDTTKDFRSIIDDLTIENKKLERRLKSYTKLHDSHNSSNDQKLFEIKVHSLEVEEKRELQEILYGFVRSLPFREQERELWVNGCQCTRAHLNYHKRASPQASPQIDDSAYASMSASGPDSSTPSGNGSRHDQIVQPAERQNLQCHRYDPEGLLLPLAPTTMAEQAKKRLVVRRLEQIFAGKGNLASPHHQALQKEDVLDTAKRANDFEGPSIRMDMKVSREAPIMSEDTEDTSKEHKSPAGFKHQAVEVVENRNIASNLPNSSFKEQRPTRPVDLDPIRAQYPADNLGYLKHLGFSPLGPTDSLEEDGGWIRLNLLMNMAQLHMLNVTCDFVREALSEYGVHFEMSDDGQKIRWKGDSWLRRTTGDSSWRRNENTVDAQSPRKRPKTTHHYGHRSISRPDLHRNDATPYRDAEQQYHKSMYTPFFHFLASQDSDGCTPGAKEKDDMPYMQQSSDKLTIMSGPDVCESSTLERRKLDNGLIIFYQNAHFFADLTGDPVEQRDCELRLYELFVPEPLGKPRLYDDIHCVICEKRGPLEEAKELPEPMDLTDNPIPASMELAFPRQSSPKYSDDVRGPHDINLEATGIGGTYPSDNFGIVVQVRYARAEWTATPTVPTRNAPGITHDQLVKILRVINPQRSVHVAVGYHVTNLQWINYLPSALPSPLCLLSSEGESTSEEASSIG